MPKDKFSFDNLLELIKSKISSKDKNSYSYELVKNGVEKVSRKIGEEAVEVLIASFNHEKNPTKKTRQELIGEVCDLFYHNLVLLASQDIELAEILSELEKRNKKND
jgi:phosphoribosyl-ATP pyrophosphohydrolase